VFVVFKEDRGNCPSTLKAFGVQIPPPGHNFVQDSKDRGFLN